MSILTKEQIAAVEDGKFDTLEVPEWGGEVRLRSLRGTQRGDLSRDGDNVPSWDGFVCQMGIVDEKGNPLWTRAEIGVLSSKHPEVLGRIAKRILTLSGLTKEAQDAIDQNFTTTPTNGGGIDSPVKLEPDTKASTTA